MHYWMPQIVRFVRGPQPFAAHPDQSIACTQVFPPTTLRDWRIARSENWSAFLLVRGNDTVSSTGLPPSYHHSSISDNAARVLRGLVICWEVIPPLYALAAFHTSFPMASS